MFNIKLTYSLQMLRAGKPKTPAPVVQPSSPSQISAMTVARAIDSGSDHEYQPPSHSNALEDALANALFAPKATKSKKKKKR